MFVVCVVVCECCIELGVCFIGVVGLYEVFCVCDG